MPCRATRNGPRLRPRNRARRQGTARRTPASVGGGRAAPQQEQRQPDRVSGSQPLRRKRDTCPLAAPPGARLARELRWRAHGCHQRCGRPRTETLRQYDTSHVLRNEGRWRYRPSPRARQRSGGFALAGMRIPVSPTSLVREGPLALETGRSKARRAAGKANYPLLQGVHHGSMSLRRQPMRGAGP